MRLRIIAFGLLWAAASGAAATFLFAPIAQAAAQPVLQRGYDKNVSNANLAETTLTTSNVTANNFGLLFKLTVDDMVNAQPLYVPNVAITGQGTHNVVYVATMSDTLYAFDADTAGPPLWSINLATLVGATPVVIANFAFGGNKNVQGNDGILSTPVIDASTNIMYVVALTLESGNMAYRLHAVDIRSGAEPFGPGVLISGSSNSSTFDARYQIQRVSLALSGNYVVFAFGPLEEEVLNNVYAGWVMAYDKATLQRSGIFATEPSGMPGGGIWQAGRPPAIDSSGYAYVFSGNFLGGGGNGYNGVNQFSETALKLDPSQGLKLVDWFTPGDWAYLDAHDRDMSSSGLMLIPGTALVTGGGKSGDLYVLNTSNLGKFNANDTQIVQKLNITAPPLGIRGGPAFWQRSAGNGGSLLYDWGTTDVLKAYPFNGTKFATSPSAQGTFVSNNPGGILALSANGEQSGSGLLWASLKNGAAGELHVYNAENITNELWNSTMNAARDAVGNYAKFVPPLVTNGKVYMATWSNQLMVYGLVSYTVSPPSLAFGNVNTNASSAPMQTTVTNNGSTALPIASIKLTGANPGQFSQTNNCGTSVGVGGSCTINAVFTPTTTGAKSAAVTITGGNGAGTQAVALSGTGVAAPYTVSPTSLAFGNETTGIASAPMSAKVTNTGSVALAITSITLTGPNPGQYSQTNNCGTSVAVGGNCTINVVFNPTVAGAATATLSVNAGNGAGTQTVALSGTGVLGPFTVSPTSLAFGNVDTGTTSAPMAATVTNTGSAALAITSISLTGPNPGQYSQTNNCGTSVAVGGSCTINVVFKPTTAGSRTATLSVTAGNGAGTQIVALSGTGVTPPYTVSPTSLAFGNQTVNVASSPMTATVTNTGSAALAITSIAVSGPNATEFSQTNNCGTSVAVGGSCTINVVFTPTATGSRTATLSVNAGNGAGTQTVALSGTGVAAPYTVSPTSLAFGNQTVNVASSPMTATVTNTGTAALAITSIAVSGPNATEFSQTNNCGTSVAVGGNCTINVVFTPTATGSRTATLSVNAGNGAGTQTVTLGGTGVAASYTVSPTSLAFGNQTVSVASSPMTATVTNTSPAALPITSITLTGPNLGDFSQTNNCGTSVAVGGNCTINVVFKPTATGSRTATVNVNAGNGAGTQTVALSGTGVAASYTVSPTSLAFGNQTVNVASAPMPVTVTNTGTLDLPITSITLTGPNLGDFSQTNNCGTSVAVGGNCTINVVFKPTATGSKSATLSVNAGNGAGTQSVALSGTCGTASYTVSPTSLAFGNQTVNVASAPMPVTVTNTGTLDLPITSITLSGPNSTAFSQTNNCGTSVAVGANCTINVVFTPPGSGPRTATLSVNAGNGAGTQSVALSGTGVPASYTVSPSSLAFGNQTVNVASAPMPVSVTNTGTVALPITSITLSGPNSTAFSQTNNCGTSVAVGANCTINVVFKPPGTGPRTATLSVNAGDGAGTQSVALSGTGV